MKTTVCQCRVGVSQPLWPRETHCKERYQKAIKIKQYWRIGVINFVHTSKISSKILEIKLFFFLCCSAPECLPNNNDTKEKHPNEDKKKKSWWTTLVPVIYNYLTLAIIGEYLSDCCNNSLQTIVNENLQCYTGICFTKNCFRFFIILMTSIPIDCIHSYYMNEDSQKEVNVFFILFMRASIVSY